MVMAETGIASFESIDLGWKQDNFIPLVLMKRIGVIIHQVVGEW